MAYNNNVILTGNLGSDPTYVEKGDKLFAAFSLATTDSYLDKESATWQTKAPAWHNILVFKETLVERSRDFAKGARVQIKGSLSYRPFEVPRNGKSPLRKMEASIIAHSIEAKPL